MSPKRKVFFGVGLVALAATSALIFNPETYLGRYVLWNHPDVYDYANFPHRTIQNAGEPYQFPKDLKPTLFDALKFECDGEPTAGFEDFLEKTDTLAFIVIKDDTILYESYLNDHARDSLCKACCVTKAVLSALIGIAIREGRINSVNETIRNYIPELKFKPLGDLTIKQCLMQTTGLSCDDGFLPWSDTPRVYYDPDVRDLALNAEVAEEPGTSFETEEHSAILLGMVLENAVDMTLSQYLQEKIWKPLGMEYPATWSLDSEEGGLEKVESGLNARAIDFARFGLLFLKGGSREGNQIIPRDWVLESTSRDPYNRYESDRTLGYHKYLWWGNIDGKRINDYHADGRFGQYIYISPTCNAVVVRFGSSPGGVAWCEDIIPRLIEAI